LFGTRVPVSADDLPLGGQEEKALEEEEEEEEEGLLFEDTRVSDNPIVRIVARRRELQRLRELA
jgi:hypothetical protein